MKEDYLVLDWEDIYKSCIKLSKKIKEDRYNPDVIVGISRGGWIPARILSDLLENQNIANIKVEFYKDIWRTDRKPKITQPISMDVRGFKILLVDDVTDTGETLYEVKEYLIEKGIQKVRIATLHYKPHSILRPDYYVTETTAWIVYPHERYEFIKSIVKKMKNDDLKTIKKWFRDINLKQPYLEEMIEEAWKQRYKP